MNLETIDKPILDACCGSRMMWFDKNNVNTLFCDARRGDYRCTNGRQVSVNPDVIIDFRNLPFPDNSFYHVVFDPPHRRDLSQDNWMQHTYGQLLPTWETDLRRGFDECMRVLRQNGTLIFKWNEHKIKTRRIIEIIGRQPLYGHCTSAKTIWMAFMKIPN